jgi:hypothetical protein
MRARNDNCLIRALSLVVGAGLLVAMWFVRPSGRFTRWPGDRGQVLGHHSRPRGPFVEVIGSLWRR